MTTAALVTVVAGILTTVIGGVVLTLVNRIFTNFSQDVQDFKSDVEGRFDHLEKELVKMQMFREEFQAKGWNALPTDMNTAPALAKTITNLQTMAERVSVVLEKVDTRLATLDAKVDSFQARLSAHDEWERTQKY